MSIRRGKSCTVSKVPLIVYGTQYYRAPTPPPQEWSYDLDNIKKLGFNTVKILIQWRWHERIRNKYYWNDLDKLFKLCKKKGLWVVPNFALDAAPEWLYIIHNCRRVDNLGNPIPVGAHGCRYVGGWEPCLDSDEVQKEADRFVKTLVRRYRNKKNLLVWDVWNEPRSRPMGDCACSVSREKYRQWLHRKFKTVERLNRKFGKAWGSWEEINPPALLDDYAEVYLWREWAMYNLAAKLKWVYDTVKREDSVHCSMGHVGGCLIYTDILNDTSDDYLNSMEVDFYGSSLPCYGEEPRWMASLNNDWLRGVSPYYWISEIYPVFPDCWRDVIKPKDLNFWVWTSVAAGAKGLFYWQYKTERLGNESGTYGLVPLNGSTDDVKIENVIKNAKVFRKHNELLRTAVPTTADVALVYDFRSDLISRIEETPAGANFTFKDALLEYTYKRAIQGSYALFWRNNIPVDWVSIHNISKIMDYKMVYYPAPFIMDGRIADILKDYVKKGGFLVSEASMGLRSDNTWLSLIVPGCGLDSLFGCREKNRQVVSEPRQLTLPGDGLEVMITKIIVYLKSTKAKVVGCWEGQEPAITINKYGKGQAMMLGLYPGLSYLSAKDDNLVKLIKLIVNRARVETKVCLTGVKGLVITKSMKSGRKKLLFLLNYENHPQKVQVIKPELISPIDLLSNAKFGKSTDSKNMIEIPANEVCCILWGEKTNTTH